MNVYSEHQLSNMERSKTKWQKHPNKRFRVQDGQEANKRFKGQDGQEAARGEPDYELNEFKLGSPKFDLYYQQQLPFMGPEEFLRFTSTLQEKLPVTFRVN